MKSIIFVTLVFSLIYSAAFADNNGGLSSLSGSRSTRLMSYGLIVGLSRSAVKDKTRKKGMRSMIARLSRFFPKKVSQKFKRRERSELAVIAQMKKDNLTLSAIGDVTMLSTGSSK